MSNQAPLAVKHWSVPGEVRPIRLDAFARRCLPHLSRRQLQDAIRAKLFFINGRIGKKGDRLKAGDALTFHGPDHWLRDAPIPDAQLQLNIVYEDESLLALDKPAGMPTHGFSARDQNTLANSLVARQPAIAAVGKSRWEPGLVHRLDRETSGLVLVAKTRAAFAHVRRQFRRRQVKKKYWALVWGSPNPEGAVFYPMAHDSSDKGRMRALLTFSSPKKKPKAWTARTRFRKLGEAHGLSLLEVEMETGVTHQIRVHLAAIGHPIVGDGRYGAARLERFGLERHFLHAFYLEFSHPRDGRPVKIEIKLPADLEAVLGRLGMRI
ncbi:MAG TPA: RluA family pseudouridine synthase [Candidatus Binatia bacterium]|nr:RluA family pseudouridine synthase [Candidatus Binatia bacterium]